VDTGKQAQLGARLPRGGGLRPAIAALALLAGVVPACAPHTPIAIREFTIAEASGDRWPGGITRGPDGALWFTEFHSHGIGRITQSGKITEYKIPDAGAKPGSITIGPDGAMWFTIPNDHAIGRITTNGAISLFRVGTGSNERPGGIVAGPDGALWFTEPLAGAIGRLSTRGAVAIFRVDKPNATPQNIAAGSDRALWFTDRGRDAIGRISIS
jgi:virginiamycin B lyase